MNNALGNSSDITLGKILTQKMLAMPYSNENWNDMRRCDYDTNIFMNWDKSYYYRNTPAGFTYCPEDKSPRRWKQASYELTYNTTNLAAIGYKSQELLSLVKDGIIITLFVHCLCGGIQIKNKKKVQFIHVN